MFKQRLLTSLVLVPLVLLAIYYANPWFLGGIVIVLVMASGWEWLQLIPLTEQINKLLAMLILLAAVWACMQWFNDWLLVGLALWGLILLAVLTFPSSQKVWGYPVVVGAVGLLLLPLLANTIAALYFYPQGKDLVVYLLCLVWAADIGAYLMGKWCGRHKLIPLVSPGKTIEGACGGFLLGVLVALIAYFYFVPAHALLWFVIAIATIVISMLGDLFISMLKRRQKLKDTGHLIPGHGGVLDRLDSLIAALPLFYFGLRFMHSGL